MSHDQRSGLAVTGFLLLALAVALGVAAYRLFGWPTMEMKPNQVEWLGGSLLSLISGIVCLYRATDV